MELFISLKNSISFFQEHFLSLSITILLYFSGAIFILLKPQLESLNPLIAVMGHGGSRWYSPKITLELYIVWDNHTNPSLKISITIYVVTLDLYIVWDNYTNCSLKISNPTHHKAKNDQFDFSLFRKSGHCVWRDWRIKTGVVPGKQLGCFSPKPDYDDNDVGNDDEWSISSLANLGC